MPKQETIAVAMSGGVDSSTVAAILAQNGDNVVGLTLQLWDQTRLAGKHGIPEAPKAGRCCSLDDVYDARRVAEHLSIPYYVVNQEERFEKDVVRPFVSEYLAGRTPIPFSLCNNHLKFDQLLQTARSIGASSIATGHYAINEYDAKRGRWILKRPADLANHAEHLHGFRTLDLVPSVAGLVIVAMQTREEKQHRHLLGGEGGVITRSVAGRVRIIEV